MSALNEVMSYETFTAQPVRALALCRFACFIVLSRTSLAPARRITWLAVWFGCQPICVILPERLVPPDTHLCAPFDLLRWSCRGQLGEPIGLEQSFQGRR